MKRYMLGYALASFMCLAAGAQAVPGDYGQAPYGMASYIDAGTVTGPEDYLPAEPAETALVPDSGSGGNLAFIRGFSLAGTAGGIVMTVWGVGGVARAVVGGDDAAGVHRALALALSGTVLAAISSTLAGLAGK